MVRGYCDSENKNLKQIIIKKKVEKKLPMQKCLCAD